MTTLETYKGFEITESNRIEGWFMTKCETMCGESINEVKFDLDRMLIDRNLDKPVTVYFMGEFGMGLIKVEGKLKALDTKKYAQYNNAPFIAVRDDMFSTPNNSVPSGTVMPFGTVVIGGMIAATLFSFGTRNSNEIISSSFP